MESSWTDRYIKVYTLAVVDEACMDASMSATEQTYAHCQTVIDEKDATINALQVERDQFKGAFDQQSVLKINLEQSLIKLQTKYKALRAKHKALQARRDGDDLGDRDAGLWKGWSNRDMRLCEGVGRKRVRSF